MKKHSIMRLILFVISLFLSPYYLLGNNVDSLINQVKLSEGEEKVEVLTALSWELKFSNQKDAISYGLEGLDLAQTLLDKEKEAELLRNLAAIYLIKSDFEVATKYCKQAIDLFQKQENAIGIAKSTNILGLILNNKGEYDAALKAFEKSISLFQVFGDTTSIIAVEANIGNIYFMKSEFQKALPLYERIVANAREGKEQQKLATNIFNLGIVYTKLGDYPKALDYLFESANISKSNGNYVYWIKTQNEIGLIFRRLDLTDEAIDLYQTALKKAIELDNNNLIASVNNNLGLCYFKKGQLEEALKCYNTCLKIRKSLKVANVGHILNNIGRVHQQQENDAKALKFYNQALEINTSLSLDNKIALDKSNLGFLYLERGEYAQAEPFLLSAISIFKETKELKELTNTANNLTTLYQHQNQKSKELKYRSLHQQYSDTLYNKEKLLAANRIIIQEKLKETTAQIDKSNEALSDMKSEHKSAKQDNKLLFGLLISLVSLMALGIFYYVKRVRPDKQILSQNLAMTQSEKDELQNRLQEQNRDLVLFSLDMVQKEEMIKTLKVRLSSLAKKQPDNAEIRSLLNKLNISDVTTKNWSFFNEVFNKAFPDFTSKIRKNYPNLSTKELQHCILIKLNTPPVEAANILGISTQSVHTARYRLRKKINLTRKESLEDTILNLE